MTTQTNSSALNVQSVNTFIELMRASDTLTARLRRIIAEHNLTVSQFHVLEALLHLGPLSQQALAKRLLKSGGNITKVIDNLEKNGMALRRQDEHDRRSYLIELTEKGEQLISSIFPGHIGAIADLMSPLEGPELATLEELCVKLGIHNTENSSSA